MSTFDASIGLAASLEICQHYKHNGTLAASLRGIRTLRGVTSIKIGIREGVVISCSLSYKNGQREPGDIKQLIEKLDNLGYGTIPWVFTPEAVSPPTTSISSQRQEDTHSKQSVPKKLVPTLTSAHLQAYTSAQQTILLAVFSSVNGVRTYSSLVQQSQYPRTLFEQAFAQLLRLGVVSAGNKP